MRSIHLEDIAMGCDGKLVRNSNAPTLFGNPLGILKPFGSDGPEDAAANVRQVGNAPRLHMGYGSGV